MPFSGQRQVSYELGVADGVHMQKQRASGNRSEHPSSQSTWDSRPVVSHDYPPSTWQRWTQQWFCRVLSSLPHGRLTVRTPSGEVLNLGTGLDGPVVEVQVHDWRFFGRCLRDGDIGLGETYQAGWWDTTDLPSVVGWFCANADLAPNVSGSRHRDWLVSVVQKPWHWFRRWEHCRRGNSLEGSKKNIQAHYDLGNDFYRLWLDPTLTYSSALFEYPNQTLETAQAAKYERLCQLLRLRPTDRVLEIGSGWGGFASHAVRNHGCQVLTITLSEEQARYAHERFVREGIDDRAEVRLVDYRQVTGTFDKIVSIEMLEAVGDGYLETYFARVQQWLSRDGLFAAQFITCPDIRYRSLQRGVDWIQRHIFPGSLLLSLNRVQESIQQTGRLHLHDLRDLGSDYACTLRHWQGRFHSQLDSVRSQGFDEHFIRTWTYYLAYCEAAFQWRNISVVQGLWSGPNNRLLMEPVPVSIREQIE